MDRDGFFNNNNQIRTNRNLPPPDANKVTPVTPGLGNTPAQNAQLSNPSNPQNINNNPAWLNTYNLPHSVQVDVDRIDASLREEDSNKKTMLYVYTTHLLDTPSNLPVRQIPSDLDNGPLGFVIRIEKKHNDDTISFLAHIDTCDAMNTGNLLLNKYIMTKNPSLVAEFIQYDDIYYFDPIILQYAVADLVKVENYHGKLNVIVCC